MSHSSQIFDNALTQLSKLPSVGAKTAARFVFHLIKQDAQVVQALAQSLLDLKERLLHCELCGNVSDAPLCGICSDPSRDQGLICVVENIRDVMALENTSSYRGHYHVLGGLIAPLDGIAPAHLNISSLVQRLREHPVRELIFALSPNMQGDTTIFYIQKQIAPFFQAQITGIARGVAFGGALEYADEYTLGQALRSRQALHAYVKA